ncbi:type II toxin-antitoxin system Phd/YefM family antitoxin [Geomonas anaerohicana]|uniref:Type II toxin-antitoxin system Phd/YefM family antitoxin n=1 Tax=Geomonas anaerohicana TaxID=2798583 RepID=A0ABS0YCF8_9BACT|nr:type II toxin-antitoxin system Phd/YefM family antitoxin [Geomonas anaerohicana]MBJ6749993.1 type II toxin-antitoxin system Phd/YefM family antitoxin [Geomonas anaerohicana]
MSSITEEELNSKGITAIETALMKESAAIITVHGKERFIVVPIKYFHYLRECELEAALAQSKADLDAGRFVVSPPEEHLLRLRENDEP